MKINTDDRQRCGAIPWIAAYFTLRKLVPLHSLTISLEYAKPTVEFCGQMPSHKKRQTRSTHIMLRWPSLLLLGNTPYDVKKDVLEYALQWEEGCESPEPGSRLWGHWLSSNLCSVMLGRCRRPLLGDFVFFVVLWMNSFLLLFITVHYLNKIKNH